MRKELDLPAQQAHAADRTIEGLVERVSFVRVSFSVSSVISAVRGG
jgi:hypothetical protein